MGSDGAAPSSPGPASPGPAGARTRYAARPRGLTVTVLVVVGLLLAGGPAPEPEPVAAAAAPPSHRAGPLVSEPEAAAGLARAEVAAHGLWWQGTQFVARWSENSETSAVVEVTHVPGSGSVVRPAGPGVAAGAVVPEGGAGQAGARQAPAGPLTLLERHYVLRVAGQGRCAGRTADVVEAWRRDAPAGLLAARFWLDTETGLVLRREVLDEAGRTVLASAYLDLVTAESVVAAPAEPAEPAEPVEPEPEPEQALEPVDADDLRAEGWQVPGEIAGLELHSSRAGGAGSERLVHLAYSDGLGSVSVFAQPGELDPSALDGWEQRRVGPATVWAADTLPTRVAWSAGGDVYTVIADAPTGAVAAAVAALPRDVARGVGPVVTEVRARLARGLSRVAAWVGPARA